MLHIRFQVLIFFWVLFEELHYKIEIDKDRPVPVKNIILYGKGLATLSIRKRII